MKPQEKIKKNKIYFINNIFTTKIKNLYLKRTIAIKTCISTTGLFYLVSRIYQDKKKNSV